MFGFDRDVGDGSTIMRQRQEALGLFGPKGKAEANASAALVHMQRLDGRTDALAHSSGRTASNLGILGAQSAALLDGLQ